MNTETTERVDPIIGKCRECGTTTTVNGYELWKRDTAACESLGRWNLMPCSGCNRMVKAKRVRGKYVPTIKCGFRCSSATGASCECECGGRNHGANFLGRH